MAKKPISQKKAEKQQMENAVLQKVLNVFLAGMLAECYLLLVYNNYDMGTVDSMLTWHSILDVLFYVGLVLLVGGVGVGIWKRSCPKCQKIMPFVAGIGLFLAASTWISTSFFPSGTKILCIMIPIVSLLGLVFLLYQHECFLSTITLAGAFFASWVCANGMTGFWRLPVMAGAICSIVAIAVLAFLTGKAKQNEGKLKSIRLFTAECDYRVLYAVFALSAAAIVIAMVATGVAYYLLWVLGIALFAELVYYTTKLM